MPSRPHVLYLTRTGMLEPLGQSQVIAYLRGLSENFDISLMSYEKPRDAAVSGAMDHVRDECERHRIRWLPQKFISKPPLVAPVLGMIHLLSLCFREHNARSVQLVHARSYLPAAVALVFGRLKSVAFIFDMRALWPEELIASGRIRRGSLVHRVLTLIERMCLKQAAGVVSLTTAGANHLKRAYPSELMGKLVTIIPTCADLNRFTPNPTANERVYSCVGTVLSGWFMADYLAILFEEIARRDPKAKFEIITRDDPVQVRALADRAGLLGARLVIQEVVPSSVHLYVQRHFASVMFFTPGISKLASSPTRMGEVLGCGVPVITSPGVGDVTEIIQKHRVGVLMEDRTPRAANSALNQLDKLMQDPDLPVRCRRAAEALFSLSAGTLKYIDLYRSITDRGSAAGHERPAK